MELYRLKQTEFSPGDKYKTICFVSRYAIALSKWAGGEMRECFSSEHEFRSSVCIKDAPYYLHLKNKMGGEKKRKRNQTFKQKNTGSWIWNKT